MPETRTERLIRFIRPWAEGCRARQYQPRIGSPGLGYVLRSDVIPLMILRILQEGRAQRDLLDEELAVLRDLERDERTADIKHRDPSSGVENQSPHDVFLFLGRRGGRLGRKPLCSRSSDVAYTKGE